MVALDIASWSVDSKLLWVEKIVVVMIIVFSL